jgi:alpha-L-rhamnosidase
MRTPLTSHLLPFAEYAALAAKMRPVFHSRFYNSSTGVYGARALETQSLTVAPLALGNTTPASLEKTVLQGLDKDIKFNEHHFTVGSVGAKHLLPQLSSYGQHDNAMKIATQDTFPSFGYWLKLGATTCWENYSGKADPSHPPPPTHNHIFLCGGLGEWMYRQVAGVGPADNGYAKVSIAPHITSDIRTGASAGPKSANATIRSVRGPVSVQWSINTASLDMEVHVPPSVVASVSVPFMGKSVADLTIKEGGTPVFTGGKFVPGVNGISSASIDERNSAIVFEVESGVYQFMNPT